MTKIRFYCHLGFLVFFIIAGHFYLERVIFSDSAYYLFKIVDLQNFNIEIKRYGAFPSQILTLIGLKLHFSLRTLIFIFSISFVILYYSIYIIINKVFKEAYLGIALIMILIFPISISFFHIVTETHQCIAYGFLFHGFIFYNDKYKMKSIYAIILGIILITFCCITHPIGVFFILFSLGFLFINNGLKINKTLIFYFFYLFIILIIKFLYTKDNSYEGNYIGSLKHIVSIFGNIKSNHSYLEFYRHFFDIYLIPLFFSCWLFIVLLKKKDYLNLVYVFGYLLIFCFIILISFHSGDSQCMMEKVYMDIFYITFIPFTYFVVRENFETNKYLRYVLLFTFLISISRIYITGQYFNARIQYIDKIVYNQKNTGQEKIVTLRSDVPYEFAITWSFGVETLLYSSLDNNNSVNTYICNDSLEVKKYLSQNDFFLCVEFYPVWLTKDLNHSYFNLPDKPYVYIKPVRNDINTK